LIKYIFIITFFISSLYCVERSAFGAGDINSDNPYGLSESEKIIFANKKKISLQEKKILRLQEQLEGIRSVVDSVSSKLGKTTQRINILDKEDSSVNANEFSEIKNDISELKRVQSENYEKINSVLRKLSEMIDEIDNSYVTEQELSKVMEKKHTTNRSIKPKLTNSQKLKDSVALYRKKHYTKAFAIFTQLANDNYKPATSNYYLGEISYYKKRYSDAIVYYKKSVGYYDRASYMPTLLLHTGIAFDKLDDIENREKFFGVLNSSYPQSEEAKIAEKYLN